MNGINIFDIVKRHIDEMDYYGLLAGGAPADEFDIESRAISEKIHIEQSVVEIAEIIAKVFNAQFNEQDDLAVFLPVAEKIKKNLLG